MKVFATDFLKNKRNLRLIIGTLCAANAIATFTPSLGAREAVYHSYEIEQAMTSDITLEEIKNMIYSSPRLTDEEKAALYNEALFEDILPYINQSEQMKFIYRSKFDELDIKNLGPLMFKILGANGWYAGNPSSNLYVRNYDINDPAAYDTLSHEYMHATQDISGYPFFYEPAAEIAASEYYGGEIDAYRPTVKALKVLMEIIGSEPIKQYVYTGDFSMIEERVRPNLTDEEYAEFMDCISQELGPKSASRNERLMVIYQSLYLNIYGTPMKGDQVINRILSDDSNLNRSYFNERLENYYISGGKTGIEYHYLDSISEKENMFTIEHHK